MKDSGQKYQRASKLAKDSKQVYNDTCLKGMYGDNEYILLNRHDPVFTCLPASGITREPPTPVKYLAHPLHPKWLVGQKKTLGGNYKMHFKGSVKPVLNFDINP